MFESVSGMFPRCVNQYNTYEHLAHFMMMNTDIQAIYDVQCRFINFRDDRMIGVRRCMDYPQAIVVSVEIYDVVFCRVERLSAVDVLKDF